MARPPRVKNPYFLIFAQNNGKTIGRLGLVVSRKVSARAVERNRIKRLIRESYRTCAADLSGLDVVVLARQAATRLDNNSFLKEIGKHWHNIGSSNGKSPDRNN